MMTVKVFIIISTRERVFRFTAWFPPFAFRTRYLRAISEKFLNDSKFYLLGAAVRALLYHNGHFLKASRGKINIFIHGQASRDLLCLPCGQK
jgi:hypothetical protein